MDDLLDIIAPLNPRKEIMAEGAVLLRGAALPFEKELLAALNGVTAISSVSSLLPRSVAAERRLSRNPWPLAD
jgi:hypothetical protein